MIVGAILGMIAWTKISRDEADSMVKNLVAPKDAVDHFDIFGPAAQNPPQDIHEIIERLERLLLSDAMDQKKSGPLGSRRSRLRLSLRFDR